MFNKTFKVLISITILSLFSNLSVAKDKKSDEIANAYYKSYNYEKSGNYLDAIKSLQLVYNKYSTAYGVNNRLGYLYRLNGQYKNAEKHYKQASTALPDSLTPKLGLMYVYLLAKNYDAASKLGYQVLSIDYYNYYGNFRLAYALRQNKQFEIAEKILIKMLVRYPSDVLFLTELGLLRYQQKNTTSAKSIMQEVLILDPENVDARSILSELGNEHAR